KSVCFLSDDFVGEGCEEEAEGHAPGALSPLSEQRSPQGGQASQRHPTLSVSTRAVRPADLFSCRTRIVAGRLQSAVQGWSSRSRGVAFATPLACCGLVPRP